MRKIKKHIHYLLSISLLILLFFSYSAMSFAAATVTFADNKLLVFNPGSAYTSSDLFENFKGVMPGDKLTEEITIENKNKDFYYIKVYLRAIVHDEVGNPLSQSVTASGETVVSMQDFLAQLSMQVKKGTDLIFDASPDELDGLAANVLLGRLRRGESLKLDVVLTVPIDLGNEYANRVGEVDWVFTVEGFNDPVPTDTTEPTEPPTDESEITKPPSPVKPDPTEPPSEKPEPSKPDVPHTGESKNPWTTILGLALVLTALVLILFFIRRIRKKQTR